MRDYLEELLDGAGALLEELRKAERSLSGAAGTEGGVEPPSGEKPDVGKLSREEAGRPDDPEDAVNDPVNALKRRSAPEQEEGWEGRREREARTGQSGMIADRERDEENDPQALSRSYEGPGESWEERGTAPLAARLEQLDRAVLSPKAGTGFSRQDGTETYEGRTAPLRRAALPGFDGGEQERARQSGPGGLSAPGGGADWVEQADQAFRRDSRRYDGGFYLY